MDYTPIRTRWVVLAFLVVVVLSSLCSMAAGDWFYWPRLLWDIPGLLLDALALGLAGILIARLKRYRERPRSGD
jgi:hypothetical protein